MLSLPSVEEMNYLWEGLPLIFRRSIVGSSITKEIIGSPGLYCDDKFVWSNSYMYHVAKGVIRLNDALKENMKRNNFEVPELTAEGKSEINSLLEGIGFQEVLDNR